VLETHELVETCNGYEIYRRKPGFEFTPISLGKIASFIVRGPGGSVTVAAFMYSMPAALEDEKIQEAGLLKDAVHIIEDVIDREEVTRRRDLTFEYHGGAWIEVSGPRWWISTAP